jgi:SAM-dependent methyltransferase
MLPATKAGTSVFDGFVEEYEDACARGLDLSGESRDFFALGRVEQTARLCSTLTEVERIVDFGCGLGHSTPHLLTAFPEANIVGVDTSEASVQNAQERYGSARAQFAVDIGLVERDSVQIVYSNGTFHHISPSDRPREVQTILRCLTPGGLFALWENNPWNPGTRLVMKRIPFDRDAKLLSYLETQRLLRQCGFVVIGASFHFYFPRPLKALRRFEPYLESLPFGAQYCVLAQRPS